MKVYLTNLNESWIVDRLRDEWYQYNNTISVDISDEELDKRKSNWIKPDLKFKSGILYKYCKNVSDASHGCITAILGNVLYMARSSIDCALEPSVPV